MIGEIDDDKERERKRERERKEYPTRPNGSYNYTEILCT